MFPFYKMHHLPGSRDQILRRQAFFQATMMPKDEGTGCKVIQLVSSWVFSLLFHWNNTLVNLNSLLMKAFPYFVIRPSLQWQPTPVLLSGKSHGWRSLVGCSPWGHQESDTTERLHFHFSFSLIGEGNGNPLQCSCLENPRDGGAWWAAVYGVAQGQTWLKRLNCSSIPCQVSGSLKRVSICSHAGNGICLDHACKTQLDKNYSDLCGCGLEHLKSNFWSLSFSVCALVGLKWEWLKIENLEVLKGSGDLKKGRFFVQKAHESRRQASSPLSSMDSVPEKTSLMCFQKTLLQSILNAKLGVYRQIKFPWSFRFYFLTSFAFYSIIFTRIPKRLLHTLLISEHMAINSPFGESLYL